MASSDFYSLADAQNEIDRLEAEADRREREAVLEGERRIDALEQRLEQLRDVVLGVLADDRAVDPEGCRLPFLDPLAYWLFPVDFPRRATTTGGLPDEAFQDDPTGADSGIPSTGQEYRHIDASPEGYIIPEGDERCDFTMDACVCMKRKGHVGLHACAHGGWR